MSGITLTIDFAPDALQAINRLAEAIRGKPTSVTEEWMTAREFCSRHNMGRTSMMVGVANGTIRKSTEFGAYPRYKMAE